MVWQKQAEKWAVKALKAPLSAFEIKHNLQVLLKFCAKNEVVL